MIAPPPDAEVAAKLHAILASDEFRKHVSDYLSEWLEKKFAAFLPWLRHLSPAMRTFLLVTCLLFLAAVALQIYFMLRAPSRSARVRRGPAAIDAGEEPEALAARAQGLASAGRLRDAARVLHQAALLRLSRARALPWRADLADWEWVARLGEVPGLAAFTRSAQRLAYGPAPDPAGWEACARLYRELR